MSPKVKVLFVTNSSSGGGAERATNVLVDSLWQRKLEVALCTINSGKVDVAIPSCPIFSINRDPQSGIVSTAYAFLKFKRIIRKYDPQIVVFGCELPELFAFFVGNNFKKVIILHTSEPWVGRRCLGKVVRLGLSKQKASWVRVSEHLNLWGANNAIPITIANPSNFEFKNSQELGTNIIKRLIFIGRLSEEKQPNWVLQLSRLMGMPTLIVGEGSMKSELEIYSKKHSLEVDFHGYADDPWALVLEGDLLVIPSKFEGDCLVLLEAIANNVPFQLNNISDLRRFGFDENLYFNSPFELSEKLSQKDFSLDQLVIPLEARIKILENRSTRVISEKWETLLSKLSDTLDS